MEWFELEGEGLLARAICHECDHLDGKPLCGQEGRSSVGQRGITRERGGVRHCLTLLSKNNYKNNLIVRKEKCHL